MSENKLAVYVNGIRWVPFSVDFMTQEGLYSVELFAVDRAHAEMRLEELKATAQIGGEIIAKGRVE